MTARKRRARDSGSVYYAKKARRWEAVITVTDPDTGARRRVKQVAPDREGAEKLLDRMIAERRESGTVARRDFTVADALDDLFRYPPATWKSAKTLSVNRTHAARLAAALGQVPLARLNAGMVERHLGSEITRRRLSASTVRDELSLLRKAIERAQRDERVGHTTALLAKMPAGAAVRQSQSMTVEQAARLLGPGLTPWWRAWMTIGIMLGLRPGELGALSWDDIDLDAGVLDVRHSLHDSPAGLVRGDLKTEKSRRTMQMPAAVDAALRAWRKEQAAQRLHAGPAWHDTGMIFTDGFGRAMSRHRMHRGFRRACQAAGLGDRDWQPRELRHTFISMLSHHGVDIEVIADAAGHVNSNVTRTVYRHSLSPKVSAAAVVMDSVFGAGAGAS